MAQIETRLAGISAGATQRASGTAATSFAGIYAGAVAAAGGPAATAGSAATTGGPAATLTSGRLNANGVPVDLAAYGNGKVPASALGTVEGTRHRLWAPAASSAGAMIQAARRDGVHIGITDSYRPYAEQVDLARRKGLYSQGGLAAKPGTSDHGWGLAVDLDLNAKAQAWMGANGARYGFVADTPREPWHWTYTPKA
jgi:hypothetical protein